MHVARGGPDDVAHRSRPRQVQAMEFVEPDALFAELKQAQRGAEQKKNKER